MLWTKLSLTKQTPLSCQTTWQQNSLNSARRIKWLTFRRRPGWLCKTMGQPVWWSPWIKNVFLVGKVLILSCFWSPAECLRKRLGRGEQMWEQAARRKGCWKWRFQVSCDVTWRGTLIPFRKKERKKKKVKLRALVMDCTVEYLLASCVLLIYIMLIELFPYFCLPLSSFVSGNMERWFTLLHKNWLLVGSSTIEANWKAISIRSIWKLSTEK